jgi:hypothetical protein
LGVEKDFPEQQYHPYRTERRETTRVIARRKRTQQESCYKENSNRAYYLPIEKYRILADVFRNRLRKYNRISDIVAGLVNYRILNHQN